MDLKTDAQNTCSVSSLKRVSKPEWIYTGKEGDFKVRVAVVGTNILHSQIEGHRYYKNYVKSIQL
jgi:hypothetical protein